MGIYRLSKHIRLSARVPLLSLLACVGISAAGCFSNPFRSQKEKKVSGELTGIKKGMRSQSIVKALGAPRYVNEGEGDEFGRDVWVYPSGYIIMVRHMAHRIVPVDDPRDLPQPKGSRRDLVGQTRDLDYFGSDGYGFQDRDRTGGDPRLMYQDAAPRPPPTRYPNQSSWIPGR